MSICSILKVLWVWGQNQSLKEIYEWNRNQFLEVNMTSDQGWSGDINHSYTEFMWIVRICWISEHRLGNDIVKKKLI